jgi:protein TonB
VAGLLAVVLLAGIASFIFSGSSEQQGEQTEEFQIVDIIAPPPPPPPPPDEETIEEEEIEDPIEPLEMSTAPEDASEKSTEVDLGIDLGDLIASEGSGFVLDIPHFGRGGGGSDDDGGLLGDDGDTPPMPMNRTQPIYPNSLLKKGIGGKVMISCVVDTDGQVTATTIKQSSGQPELDKAAVTAVSRWKFKPAKRQGKNFKATCNVPFTFEVKKS